MILLFDMLNFLRVLSLEKIRHTVETISFRESSLREYHNSFVNATKFNRLSEVELTDVYDRRCVSKIIQCEL